jgi:hypothetical protein
MTIVVGTLLYGDFDDSGEDKVIEEVGKDWIVAREVYSRLPVMEYFAFGRQAMENTVAQWATKREDRNA